MNEDTNNNLNFNNYVVVIPEKADPVDVASIRQPKEHPLMAFFGQVRSAGNRSHTGYDYMANEGTPVKAVQSGEITRIRFGRPKGAINRYYEKIEKKYYEKEKFYCPQYIELIKKKIETGTINDIVFDTAKCTDCQNRFFSKYSIVKTSKKNEEGRSYEIITINRRIIKGKEQIETRKIISDKKGDNSKIDWYNNRCGKDCFGIQVWLKTISAILSQKNTLPLFKFDTPIHGYYAYYAHLSALSQTILSEIDSKLNRIKEKAEELKKKKQEEGIALITFEELFEELKEKNILDTTMYFTSTPPKISINDIIGESGCTGNAYDMMEDDQHLHFECRTGDAEKGSQISPNNIVKTPFYIAEKGNHSNKIEHVSIDELNNLKEQNWLSFIKKTDKSSIKRNKFQIRCYNEAWASYKGKISESRFINEIWKGELGIKAQKWKNFEFTDEKELADIEANKWIEFVKNDLKSERKQFEAKWWTEQFEKNYEIISGTTNNIISFL